MTAPFERLLVPVDFSENATRALHRALLLPLARGAELVLLHVLPPKLPRALGAELRRAANARLARLRSEHERVMPAVSAPHVAVETRVGAPFVGIAEAARAHGAELVVLGRHGHQSIRDRLLGVTAERVIRTGRAPVLVVGDEPARGYRRPLLATDLEISTAASLALLLRALDKDVEKIALVHAVHVPFEGFLAPTAAQRSASEYRRSFTEAARKRLAQFAKRHERDAVSLSPVVRIGDPRLVIIAEAVLRGADLVVVGTHGRTGVAHALAGSVAEWLCAASPCDVLVARPQRARRELPEGR